MLWGGLPSPITILSGLHSQLLRSFATTRFRCTKIRYTGDVCGCAGSVGIEPSVLLPVGGANTLASVVDHKGNDRFKCPGCEEAVAWHIHGPVWRPTYCDAATSSVEGVRPVR
jgi:hypothetical protein